ncbi:MAG TPA: 50S ribosomal protein L7Ae [Candidatus Methanomethylicus sp.]|nr:50S ribosomal protein L7Ae [Candidatus Methanomethylicus sp.]HRU81444.1 50S ribosomal protein L7Ae [Candidatus Methanomethylicus sp.]
MSKKPMFVRFEVSPEIMERAYETVKLAKDDGKLRKGANEATKAVERGITRLLVIAVDVDPPEIVAHLPLLADEKKISYVYVDSKIKLGEAAGIDVPSAAIAVVEAGKGKPLMDEVISKVAALRLKGSAAEAPVAEKPKAAEEKPKKEEPKAAEEKPKKEEAPAAKAEAVSEEKPKEKPKKKAAKKAAAPEKPAKEEGKA